MIVRSPEKQIVSTWTIRKSSKISSAWFFVFFLTIIMLLPACMPIISIDAEIDLGTNERWEMSIAFLLPAENADDFGLLFMETLNSELEEIRSEGVEVDWERRNPDRDGNVPFVITMKGRGYELMDETLFGGSSTLYRTQVDGKERLVFDLDTGGGLFGEETTSETLTLHGGRILETNGTKQGSRAVRWDNTFTTYTAVMELPSSPALNVLWGVLIVGLLGGLGYFMYRKGAFPERISAQSYPYPNDVKYSHGSGNTYANETPVQSSASQRPAGNYCPHCGQPLPQQAVYCPNCGKARKVD